LTYVKTALDNTLCRRLSNLCPGKSNFCPGVSDFLGSFGSVDAKDLQERPENVREVDRGTHDVGGEIGGHCTKKGSGWAQDFADLLSPLSQVQEDIYPEGSQYHHCDEDEPPVCQDTKYTSGAGYSRRRRVGVLRVWRSCDVAVLHIFIILKWNIFI
jgi:hypothetical protein